MKNMSFKILTALLFGLLFSLSLPIGYVTNAYSEAYVIENIDYNPVTQIYTYTYTLRNLMNQQVWWWGIWYEENPEALIDDDHVDSNGFAATDREDCTPGWRSTAPAGRMGFYLYNAPSGEPGGFYSTYASDFQSAHEPTNPEAIDLTKFGGIWGWNGADADIITAYGIQKDGEGYYVIKSKKYFPGKKKFFYNTTDYWNSYYDATTDQRVIGGFEFVATTQHIYSLQTPLIQGYNLISQPFERLIDSDGLPITYQASTLLTTIPGCQEVIRFDSLSQKTETYLSWNNTPIGTDFLIQPGEGYYVEVSADSSLDFVGLGANEPQTLNLSLGYNFISFLYGSNLPADSRTGYTSSTLLAAIPECKSVIRFNSLSQKTESYRYWDGYAVGTEFDIRVGEGYIVEVLTDISWTPEALSLPSLPKMRLKQNVEPPYYSLTSPAATLSVPVISDIRESYQTSGSVIISWLTDRDSPGEVHYSTQSDLSYYKVVKDNIVGKVHRAELSGLQPGKTCYYEVQSGASVNDNGGIYYSYTPLKLSSPLDNLFIGGRVLKADQSPVSGALVFVTINQPTVHSYPLCALTDGNGFWILNLADLKNSSTGDSLLIGSHDPITIEVNDGNGWQKEDLTRSISDLTEGNNYAMTLFSALPVPLVVATPTISATSDAFADSIRVEMFCDTKGAIIHYTKDGSDPTTSSLAYTAPLTLNRTATIKAKGFKSGCTPSDTAIRTYTRMDRVNTPVISPAFYTFSDSISISITCGTEGAVIRYTTDGSEPIENSMRYTAPLPLAGTATIKAKGFKDTFTPSDTASGNYTARVATPTLSPAPRTFYDPMSISMSCATQGAIILYTTDGTEPTENSPAYTAPVTLTGTATVKAKGFKNGFTPGDTANGLYTKITGKVTTPILFPAPGIFAHSIVVSIICDTPGSTIRYTTDGTEPTENSPAYTAPLNLTEDTTTIKAKGFKGEWEPSDMASGTYNKIMEKIATPVLSPISDNFTSSTRISITCDTEEATIRYTTDGSEPTENSPAYTAPLTLTETATIKARGFKSDHISSDTAGGNYTKTTPPQITEQAYLSTGAPTWIPYKPWSYPSTSIWTSYQPWSYPSTSTWMLYQTTPWSLFNWMNY